MNRQDPRLPMMSEAVIEYLDNDFRVIRAGTFVRCAVSGERIPLEELRYWSVALQQAYASPEAVIRGRGETLKQA